MKRPGHCTLCEDPVFEILQERDGEPIKVGQPLENAWRVSFRLSDGTIGDITFCAGCLDAIPNSLDEIWAKCLERFDFEETRRVGEQPKGVAEFLEHIKTLSIRKEVGRMMWTAVT